MPNIDFHIERLSFWLGFLAATLFWWLFSRIKPLLPLWWRQIRRQIEIISSRNFSGVDDYLRQQTLLRAQNQHVASSLFSLDEILIPPRLLVPPAGQDPDENETTRSIASSVIPYLPDWPELVASFGVPTLSPLEALKSKRHIALIGQPGSGKTVALAHLASQLARRDPVLEQYHDAVVLYLHVVDLDTRMDENQDVVQAMIKCAASSANVMMQPQINRYLNAVIHNKQRQIVMLLDGLDELPQADLLSIVAYLDALLKKLPRLQIVTTASPDYIAGLAQVGFYPLALAAWNIHERNDFAKKWGDLWMEQVVPEAEKHVITHPVEARLMEYWLEDETGVLLSPLEWTLRLWGAYAGDLSGTGSQDNLKAMISRFLPDPAVLPAVEQLAHHMLQNQKYRMNFDEMEQHLSSYKADSFKAIPAEVFSATLEIDQAAAPPADPLGEAPSLTNPDQAGEQLSQKSPHKTRAFHKNSIVSQGEQILQALIDGGILSQHTNNWLRFSSPVFLGFLSTPQTTSEEAAALATSMDQTVCWPAQIERLHYTAACTENADWITPLLAGQNSSLFPHLLIAARWLNGAPPKATWRNTLIRSLISLIQNETQPFSLRARAIAAFYRSADVSANKLYKQLLLSKSPAVRRLALLGCGASSDPTLTDSVLSLLADRQPEVRYTACLALAAIPGESSLKAMVEILLSGDEEIRQAAAEALSQDAVEGYQILQEATTHEDLLTRRAAVVGLLQVHESWAQTLLEKVAVEDAQWVVRNAAAQGLSSLKNPLPTVPPRLIPPSETGWLLTFASKLGLGILPGQPGTDILLTVLKTGAIREKIAALTYLRDQPGEDIYPAIYSLLDQPEDDVREAAVHALWWMVISGVKLPSLN